MGSHGGFTARCLPQSVHVFAARLLGGSDKKHTYRSEVLTERDIPSLGVRTGGWVEVDVSAAAVAVVVALGGGIY